MNDLTGQRYGRLMVVKPAIKPTSRASRKHRAWECLCDCGATCVRFSSDMRVGGVRSCGCLADEERRKKKLPDIQACGRAVFYQYRRAASSRELEFTLEIELFVRIILSDCFYCGAAPANFNKIGKGASKLRYNGVDRRDSAVGYVPENCVPCCRVCNFAKRDMAEDVFLRWVERIYTHQRDKKG